MADCILCYKPLDADINNGREHNICEDEWQKRRDNSICTRCGDNPAKTKNAWWCDGCELKVQYRNYPGPQ